MLRLSRSQEIRAAVGVYASRWLAEHTLALVRTLASEEDIGLYLRESFEQIREQPQLLITTEVLVGWVAKDAYNDYGNWLRFDGERMADALRVARSTACSGEAIALGFLWRFFHVPSNDDMIRFWKWHSKKHRPAVHGTGYGSDLRLRMLARCAGYMAHFDLCRRMPLYEICYSKHAAHDCVTSGWEHVMLFLYAAMQR